MNFAKSMVFVLVLAAAGPVSVRFAQASPLTLPPAPAGVETVTHYGIEFSVVGSSGNRPYEGLRVGDNPVRGDVNYEFGIARVPVTNRQWLEFANAYLPYAQPSPEIPGIEEGVYFFYSRANQRYEIVPGAEEFAARMSWRMAARYVNWLNNDKRADRAAFETGAYDTSTFTQSTSISFSDQLTHTPGSRFYIPTRNEWFKATYYDPNRFGAGQEGYWRYPNRSETPLRPGFPDEGGETAYGIGGVPPSLLRLPIASYPSVQTPWGLLDASGLAGNHNEDASPSRIFRYSSGTGPGGFPGADDDSATFAAENATLPYDTATSVTGLRLAIVVPAPSAIGPVALVAACAFIRRRNTV